MSSALNDARHAAQQHSAANSHGAADGLLDVSAGELCRVADVGLEQSHRQVARWESFNKSGIAYSRHNFEIALYIEIPLHQIDARRAYGSGREQSAFGESLLQVALKRLHRRACRVVP